MALPTLDLDDLAYPQLLDILRSHIATLRPSASSEEGAWTDHNPSDPGIMLLELLAWLGEMSLYRMNQVTDAHREKFLKLLMDPPVPVTVTVKLSLTLSPRAPGDLPALITVPPGLRFATDYRDGRRFLFESYEPVMVPSPGIGQGRDVPLRARAIRELEDVVLGTSDGKPDQVYPLPDSPVLLDLTARSYDPNPRIRVGPDEWDLKSFLLTDASRVTEEEEGHHFMVEEFENRIRFGDGRFGAIPPAGQEVRLIRAQFLEGPAALVAERQLRHFLNPELATALRPGELTLSGDSNSDAEGGERFFLTPEERIREGLKTFRDPTRLVTAEDFERVALSDFNAWQAQFNAAQGKRANEMNEGRIQRVTALMNRKPSGERADEVVVGAGSVTLVVLLADDKTFDTLQKRLLAYLEPRRLLTTRLYVVRPVLKPVRAALSVWVEDRRNRDDMEQAIRAALVSYLSPTQGYDDGRGWPLGRTVRRSQLYRVVEDVPGVDHVESLALSPANEAGDVLLSQLQLPAWELPERENLTIDVKRTEPRCRALPANT